jgi:hypothetical protein
MEGLGVCVNAQTPTLFELTKGCAQLALRCRGLCLKYAPLQDTGLADASLGFLAAIKLLPTLTGRDGVP